MLDWLCNAKFPLRSLTSRLSLVIAKLPEMTWSRLTADPAIMFDHLECGNGGAHDELMSDNLVNLESLANALSSLRVALRLSPSPSPDSCSLIVHGKSLSSCFCFFNNSSGTPGDFPHLILSVG